MIGLIQLLENDLRFKDNLTEQNLIGNINTDSNRRLLLILEINGYAYFHNNNLIAAKNSLCFRMQKEMPADSNGSCKTCVNLFDDNSCLSCYDGYQLEDSTCKLIIVEEPQPIIVNDTNSNTTSTSNNTNNTLIKKRSLDISMASIGIPNSQIILQFNERLFNPGDTSDPNIYSLHIQDRKS